MIAASSPLTRGRARISPLLLSQNEQQQQQQQDEHHHLEDHNENNYYRWRDISPLRYIYVTMNGFSISLPTTIVNDNYSSLCSSLSSQEQEQSEMTDHSDRRRQKRRKVKWEERATRTCSPHDKCKCEEEYFVPPGVLEQFILSYLPVEDLCAACLVCRQWHEAGRNDDLWRDACIRLWSDGKVGMPVVRRGGHIALFWRTLWTDSVIMRDLSIRDIISFFAERPSSLETLRTTLSTVLETQDIKKAVFQFMPAILGDDPSYRFRHKWFGSYASSVIDSKRTYLTMDELCTRNGFDMHFKIYYNQNDQDLNHTNDHPDNLSSSTTSRDHNTYHNQQHNDNGPNKWKLHYHSTYYFYENYELRQDPFYVTTQHPTHNAQQHTQNTNGNLSWKWQWMEPGKVLRVGPYPLTVSRLDNWGWKLENRNVLFFYRGN